MKVKIEKKKRRSDFGQVRLSEIDIKLLNWIGEQYAVSEDHLKILASNQSKAVEGGGLLSASGVRRRYARWLKAGWVAKQKFLVESPSWLWLTRKGIRHIGLDYSYYRPSVGKLRHIYEVNGVRIYAESRFRQGDSWVSEREIYREMKRGERKQSRNHLVDAEVFYAGTLVGVEVELTVKSKKRIRKILRNLNENYDAVWYFLEDDCYKAVGKVMQEIPDHGHTFALYPLSKLTQDDRHT